MTAEKIKKRLLECASHMCFDYNGKGCGIDPYYVPEKKKTFLIYGMVRMKLAHCIILMTL